MNVLLSGMWILHKNVVRGIQDRFPEILVTPNFEQVKAMVKVSEVQRLLIISDVFNFSASKFNATRGQEAAEHLHQINPSLPMLIWSGRNYGPKDPDFPSVFNIEGEAWPIQYDSETYLEFGDYNLQQIISISEQFLKGTVKELNLL